MVGLGLSEGERCPGLAGAAFSVGFVASESIVVVELVLVRIELVVGGVGEPFSRVGEDAGEQGRRVGLVERRTSGPRGGNKSSSVRSKVLWGRRELRKQVWVIMKYTMHRRLAVSAMRGVSLVSFIGPGVSAL